MNFQITKASLCFLFFVLFSNTELKSQVVVNEIGVANYSAWQNAEFFDGWFSAWMPRCEDWVEFYNTSSSTFDVSGYWLSDNHQVPMKWSFPEGTIINGNDRLIVLLSGTGDYDPDYGTGLNTNFKLTQTDEEEFVFSDPGGNILEQYDFGSAGTLQANHSLGRISDGNTSWAIFPDATEDAPNSGTTFDSYTERPSMNYAAGYYGAPINVELTSEPGAAIYYTLDCSDPTELSTLYTGPIFLSGTTVVRAIAISDDPTKGNSFVETNTYFFNNDTHSLFTVSMYGEDIADFFWEWELQNELCGVEIFSPGGTFITEGHGDMNEHGNDSNAYPQRGFDYIDRDALGYDNELECEIFHSSDRDRFERLIFKAAGNDNYPFEINPDTAFQAPLGGAHIRDAYVQELALVGGLELDTRKTASCIVYINGVYSGVYEMREKVDDNDYTEYYHDQPKGYVDFIKQWAWVWEEMGDGKPDWDTLVEFIETNDMTNQANYDYVRSQYDIMSLIDYFTLNSYVVCADWLNWNTAWWRGTHPDGDAKKWRYALWDEDATFNHYINWTGVPDQSPQADPCQLEEMGAISYSGHETNFVILLENEEFFADYIQRYAALSNTIFSCERMHSVLDSMINVIAPEMERHTNYWGGSVDDWMNNVNDIHDFIDQRCNDNIITGLEDCYEITAYNVTVMIEGIGIVDVNSALVNNEDDPWTGVYFGDIPIDLEAIVPGCAEFTGWEIISGDAVIEDLQSEETTLTISSDVIIQATFELLTGTAPLILNVTPEGCGNIFVNGTEESDFPTTELLTIGDEQTLIAAAQPGCTFDHWEIENTAVSPDVFSQNIIFSTCLADSITAIFTGTVDMDNLTTEDIFKLYPNPAANILTVEYNGSSNFLFVHDIIGNLVMEEPVNSSKMSFDISGLSPGLYVVSDGQNRVMRLIVMR